MHANRETECGRKGGHMPWECGGGASLSTMPKKAWLCPCSAYASNRDRQLLYKLRFDPDIPPAPKAAWLQGTTVWVAQTLLVGSAQQHFDMTQATLSECCKIARLAKRRV